MPGALESLAYAIARGCTRAYLDVLQERNVALEEVPNGEDRTHAQRMRDAVLRAQGHGDPGPNGPTPGS